MKKIILLIIFFSFYNMLMSQTNTYCRFEYNGKTQYGIINGERVTGLKTAPWISAEKSGVSAELNDVKLLHPSEPSVIIGLSKSYKNAWEDETPSETVRWFIKPPTSAGSPGEDVVMPELVDQVKVECELVIIVGKKVKNASVDEAGDAIFGYTIGNDIVGSIDSFHKLQGEPLDTKEGVLAPGLKIGDNFEPYGPFIYTGIDWKNRNWKLTIENKSTGKHIVHENNTNSLIYNPAKIVSDMSKMMTLQPGDVISTGTSKSFVASDGDVVTCEIEGLGTLQNKIVK